MKKILDSVFNLRTSIIFGATVISTAIFYTFGKAIIPVIIGGLLLFFSVLYSVLFSKPVSDKGEKTEKLHRDMRNLAREMPDKLTPVIERLGVLLVNIKSCNNDKFTFIQRFMDDIASFEEIIPQLVRSYRKGASFLKSRDVFIANEVRDLQSKLNSTTQESVRQTYEKALQEKQQTLNELQDIRNNLDECESKLHYILSTLEKIETIIQSDELKDNVSNETTNNINQELEIFSGSVKDIAKVMKL